jgi:hypothetical protein
MRKIALAATLGLSLAPLPANATTVQNFFSGAHGVTFSSVIDSCRTVFIRVEVAASGTHNISQKSTPNVALVFLFVSNSCTGTEIAESGSAGNIQFSAQGAANGTQVPRSITASGVIPMTCFVGCTSDSLTFNMTLTAAGPVLQVMDNSQTTYPVTPSVTVKSHSDFNLVVATGSLTVSTQNLGSLPISLFNSSMDDGKNHQVTITH